MWLKSGLGAAKIVAILAGFAMVPGWAVADDPRSIIIDQVDLTRRAFSPGMNFIGLTVGVSMVGEPSSSATARGAKLGAWASLSWIPGDGMPLFVGSAEAELPQAATPFSPRAGVATIDWDGLDAYDGVGRFAVDALLLRVVGDAPTALGPLLATLRRLDWIPAAIHWQNRCESLSECSPTVRVTIPGVATADARLNDELQSAIAAAEARLAGVGGAGEVHILSYAETWMTEEVSIDRVAPDLTILAPEWSQTVSGDVLPLDV